jgi:tRNA threonylcarbamoyladenosine biosynthesis protein TsaB
MRILAIDTASDAIALAAGDAGREPVLLVRDGDRQHSVRLLSMVDELAGGSRSFDRICVVSGPGAYSGLRVGIATARGLSLALGVPLVAVETHQAVAGATDLDGTWLAIHPAGRGEFAVRECTASVCTGALQSLSLEALTGRRLAGEGAGPLGGVEIDAAARVAAAFRQAPDALELYDAVYLRAPNITKPRGPTVGRVRQESRQ